jgi:hypothetical protein
MHNGPHQGSQGSLKRMRMSRRSVQKDKGGWSVLAEFRGGGLVVPCPRSGHHGASSGCSDDARREPGLATAHPS